MWTPVEDIVLISAWLNTSKDPVVANEQRQGAFWKRIAAYFAASPKIAAGAHREEGNCKQRWHKINTQVNKFCGAFEAALDTMNVEERSPGVKAAKAKLKKNGKNGDLKETLSKFEGMWEIKQKDLVSKERVTTKRLLESLIAKKEALDESEVALKKKLIDELLFN
ncbi:glutathione S-transferase T3-like isoform X1 [Raphanus sativus]|uniref:Glutathione S-transferase T3-like isoform X1 n=1 Tax=Raphanus sativus TaxID=3726 RepID=A0A9W3D5K6_RAPSA|nr:glutathione S-transferase T3-like isoform X1 [Raphanus sativus]